MKREAEVRELFISNTINLIVEGGFEKATTKELTYYGGSLPDMKMNEVYLYRLFGSKEKLYEEAFLTLDAEFYAALRNAVDEAGGFENASREFFFRVFLPVWELLMREEARCRCYVRYYYSIYYKGSSFESHKSRFAGLISEWSVLFKEEADVGAILHSVLVMLFDFSIRVYNGQLIDDEINRPHVFNVLYSMMMTYFKEYGKQ